MAITGYHAAQGPTPGRSIAPRLLTVDALRAVAALVVLLRHLPGMDGVFVVLKPLQAVGHTGVGLFLVLSGFSIHYRWAATRLDHGARFEQRTFWRRRFRRLYPSYAAAVVVALIVAVTINDLHQPAWALTGDQLPAWLVGLSQILLVPTNIVPVAVLSPVVWSLGLEIQLYAAYACVVRVARRFDPVRVLAVAAAVTLAWRVGAQLVTTSTPVGAFLPDRTTTAESRLLYAQMPARCFEWFLGALAAEAYVGRVRLHGLLRSLPFGLAIFVVAAVLHHHPVGAAELNGNRFRVSDVILDPLFGVAFFVVLNWATTHEEALTGAPLRAFAFVGVFSYSLYLIHVPALEVVGAVLPASTPSVISIPVFASFAVVAAYGFFLLIERRYVRR